MNREAPVTSAGGYQGYPHIALKKFICKNSRIRTVLDRSSELRLPQWYLGGGCVAQTIWNLFHGYPPEKNIKDIDLAYYDPDLSFEAEDRHIKHVQDLLGDVPVELDIKNQARVHLWFQDKFGYQIQPYQSIEEAITTWPTTSTCVGVRIQDGQCKVYAPYGLDDLFNMVVRPNKKQIRECDYVNKVKRWKKCWPRLKIIDWEEA